VFCSTLLPIFLFSFFCFYKFNRHSCHGAYWCTHNPAHMPVLFFQLHLPFSNKSTNKYLNTIICKKIHDCSSDTPNAWWMLKEITHSMHMIHDKIHEKHKFINKLRNQTLNLLQFITNVVLCTCVLFYSSFVCIFAYANVYFKTTKIKQNIKIILIAGVPSSQALPGFLITAPPSVCVPALLGALAVWIQNPKKEFT